MILINQNPINLSHTYLTTVHGSIQAKTVFVQNQSITVPLAYGRMPWKLFFFRLLLGVGYWLLAGTKNEPHDQASRDRTFLV